VFDDRGEEGCGGINAAVTLLSGSVLKPNHPVPQHLQYRVVDNRHYP